MLKIHPFIFLEYKKNDEQSLRTSCFRFSDNLIRVHLDLQAIKKKIYIYY